MENTNGLAIAAFVLTMCGIFTFGVTSIVGFILGIIALTQDSRNGFAIASVIVGAFPILIWIFLLTGWIVGASVI